MHLDSDKVPVVQAGALELAVIQLKAQRPDQVQADAGRRAGARRGARVLRDERVDQDQVDVAAQPGCPAPDRPCASHTATRDARRQAAPQAGSSARRRRTALHLLLLQHCTAEYGWVELGTHLLPP